MVVPAKARADRLACTAGRLGQLDQCERSFQLRYNCIRVEARRERSEEQRLTETAIRARTAEVVANEEYNMMAWFYNLHQRVKDATPCRRYVNSNTSKV